MSDIEKYLLYLLKIGGLHICIRANNDESAQLEAEKILSKRSNDGLSVSSATLVHERVVKVFNFDKPKRELKALKDYDLYDEKI